jgi:hypothetical protein
MPYDHLVYSKHALKRMVQRSISPDIVKQALLHGEVIENYADDLPFPSFLMLFFTNRRPVHIVAADNHEMKITHIITAYEPSSVEWKSDFRRSRPE